MPVILALRLRQEDHEFKASLSYIARSRLKNRGVGWAQWLMIVILPTQEMEIWRSIDQGHPRGLGGEVSKTLTNKLGVVAYACNHSCTGIIGRRVMAPGQS
jgi:hypothetical protein